MRHYLGKSGPALSVACRVNVMPGLVLFSVSPKIERSILLC